MQRCSRPLGHCPRSLRNRCHREGTRPTPSREAFYQLQVVFARVPWRVHQAGSLLGLSSLYQCLVLMLVEMAWSPQNSGSDRLTRLEQSLKQSVTKCPRGPAKGLKDIETKASTLMLHIYIYAHITMYTYTPASTCVYVCISVCMYIYIYIYIIYIYIYIYTYTHVLYAYTYNTHFCIYLTIILHIYIYIYTQISTKLKPGIFQDDMFITEK